MKPVHLSLLKTLALMGALNSRIPVTSGKLGESMGMSQQSASRLLRTLRSEGFIDMSIGRKSWVRITPRGKDALMKEYGDYQVIFEKSGSAIKGRVESGMGEGRYYLSRSRYADQIKEMFGFEPYPGTLNIRLDAREMARYRGFAERARTIEGFVSEGRTFGDVSALPAEIEGIKCVLLSPKRSHYSDTVEVAAPVRLRDALKLRDGDEIEIKIEV